MSDLRAKKQSAFTLLELLISMALLGMFLTIINQYFVSSNTITSNIATQTTSQEELRTAGAIINDTVQRAIYVFPPCGAYTSLPTSGTAIVPDPIIPTTSTCGAVTGASAMAVQVTWSKFKFGHSDKTVTGPHNSTTWQVGINPQAPILAMIVAPKQPTLECTTGTKSQSCYQFVAYYPVPRKQLTVGQTTPLGTSLTSSSLENLPPDDRNLNTWVIMEYRKDFDFDTLPASVTINGTAISVPAIRWSDAGCQNNTTLPCTDPPETDPATSAARALPAIKKGETAIGNINVFSGRMKATVDQMIDTTTKANCADTTRTTCNGSADILIEGIAPYDSITKQSGFMIEFPVKPTSTYNSIDERGVTEVRIKLTSGLKSTAGTPSLAPVEYFTSPRNISPQ
jgi:prepilin-type N-terminal cleavage/methylation domain-containing protein